MNLKIPSLAAAFLLLILLFTLLRSDPERLELSLLLPRLLGQAETSRELNAIGASAQGVMSSSPECMNALEQLQAADRAESSLRRVSAIVSYLCESEQDFIGRAETLVKDGETPTSLEAAQVGEKLIEINELDRALITLSAYPEVAQRLINLGRIEIEYNSDEQSAYRFFAVANELDPAFNGRKSPMYLYLCLHAIRMDENIILENPCEYLYRARPNAISRGLYARRFLMEGQLEQAEALLREATSFPDASGETYFWLGTALKMQELGAEARDAFEQGIGLAPELALNYVALAELYAENGCLDSAQQSLDRATAAEGASETESAVARIRDMIRDEHMEERECQLKAVP